MGRATQLKCVFSIDVEDWFHILDVHAAPPLDEWTKLPSRVETNFYRLLDMLSEAGAPATCFFLGWVAERYPHLVMEAERRGHEVASHGYAHNLVHRMSRQEFLEDASKSRRILEDITGRAVMGYRSAGFSVTRDTSWFFASLVRAGYIYDSSVFPTTCTHGGIADASLAPYCCETEEGPLMEFPMTVATICAQRLCAFGGGYLRLAPLWLIQYLAGTVEADNRPVIYYVHPREIDPDHPRLPMGLRRRFKCYVNLRTTERKLSHILLRHPFVPFAALVTEVAAAAKPVEVTKQ
jgi:polysaccharide deacetylase family protein (PEP-CTERM system associated)